MNIWHTNNCNIIYLSANFYEMSNIKKIKIQIEKHDFWAMFTVKHGLPYTSYVKGDNKGWLQKKMVSNDKHNIFKQKVAKTHEWTL